MMKKLAISILVGFLLVLFTATIALAKKPTKCTTIQSGLLVDSAGNPITTGYDKYGYNYQAHMFVGTYDSSDRNLDGTYWGEEGDFVNDKLMMKWSDDWLANVDCNDDGKLDRGLVNGVSDGVSKGWLTNHWIGDYVDDNGVTQHFTDFVKIGYTVTGDLWGAYTVLQEVHNDPAAGNHGVMIYLDPGLGHYLEVHH